MLQHAQVTLGQLYWQGAYGLEQDHAEAQRYFEQVGAPVAILPRKQQSSVAEQAAEVGNGNAMANLGHMQAIGVGGKQNSTAALEWYRKGVEKVSRISLTNSPLF